MYSEIENIVREAGDLALQHFQTLATVSVESKGHLDLVTAADKAVEEFVIERLQSAFPDDGVFGEEGGSISSRSGRIWVVDPIEKRCHVHGKHQTPKKLEDWQMLDGGRVVSDFRITVGNLFADPKWWK